FGRWVGEMLTADNLRMMYIPPGFAHGYCVTSDAAEVAYKCTELYDPGGEIAIAWDDPAIGVAWPLDQPTLSAKDANAPRLSEIADSLPAIEIGR
ncbi:MAG: dTDP-4-dehydrorhamnose 3,5-epimerase, partial [Acidobacteriota bacterium]|nr:dTDP-4-dehydrorhamnose 3,5-epimerase [Acidobacteriota bacterium]